MTDTDYLPGPFSLNPGDHVACFFSTDEEKSRIVDLFIRDGIRKGDKIFLVSQQNDGSNICTDGNIVSESPEMEFRSGQVSVFDSLDVFIDNDSFDPDVIVSSVKEESGKAREEDFKALRILFDMTWSVNTWISIAELSHLETLSGKSTLKNNNILLCLYDLRLFDTYMLMESLLSHPKIVVDGRVCENHYFTGYLDSDSMTNPHANFHCLLNNLAESNLDSRQARELDNAFRSLGESAFLGYMIHDNGILLEISPSLAEFVGYDRSEVQDLIGMNVYNLIDCEYHKLADEKMQSESTELYEMVGVLKDGTRIWGEVCSIPITFNGKNAKFIAVRDISDRKRTENALREIELEKNYIVSTLHETMITFVGLDGTINSIHAPKELSERYGLPIESVLGSSIIDFLPPEERLSRMKLFEEVCLTGQPHRDSFPLITPNGIFWQDITLSPIHDQSGRISSMVAVMRDITNLREAEEEIKRKNKELERALSVKTEFLSMVSHELRTPLVPILGYAEMLIEGTFGKVPEDFIEPLKTIITRANALDALIDDLLLLSRMERSILRIDTHSFPVRAFLDGVLATYKQTDHGKPVAITFTGEEFSIVADPMRLHQVIQNLVNNAIKYSNAAADIEINTSHDEKYGYISITDHGIGIAEEHLMAIFQPFFQVEQLDTRRHEGTGLGLAIASRIVELMDGSIKVGSKIGEGSTFTVMLPLVSRFLPEDADSPLNALNFLNIHRERSILVIDNDSFLSELLVAAIGDRNVIIPVSNGNEAIRMVEEREVDLIIVSQTSIRDTDRLSLLTALKSNEKTCEIPIVVISEDVDKELETQVLDAGAYSLIPKTLGISEIVRHITRIGK